MTCMWVATLFFLYFYCSCSSTTLLKPEHFSSPTRPEIRLRPASRPILEYTMIGLRLRRVITPRAVRNKEPSTTAALTHRKERGRKCFEAYLRRLTYQYTSRHSQCRPAILWPPW